MKTWLVALTLLLHTGLIAVNVDVRLFSQYTALQCEVHTTKTTYFLLALDGEGALIDTIADIYNPNNVESTLLIKHLRNGVSVKYGNANFGKFKGLALVPATQSGNVALKVGGQTRYFKGELRFTNRSDGLQMVNRVDLEDYVAGVVESEGGNLVEEEYYKAQAVLARSWVLRNWHKHATEGYNVKDDVTSQVYHGIPDGPNSKLIVEATRQTADTVLLDIQNEIVFGAFHANSGGQTCGAEDVWGGNLPYLKAVNDPYSTEMPQAYWQKEISKAVFVAFFAAQMGLSASDANFVNAVCSIRQTSRNPYFKYGGKTLNIRWVRENFNLRSTFFSVYDMGEKVLIKGRGYGHGVGLSQEGAMRMAQLGKSYREILTHYFSGVHLGSIKKR